MLFPNWTLWGMVLSATGAMLFMAYSLFLQSKVRTQAPVEPSGYAQNLRGLTTYATALLMLAIGFFIAGFPTSSTRVAYEETAVAMAVATVEEQSVANGALGVSALTSNQTATPEEPATPETGAFSGPPPTTTPTASPQPTVDESSEGEVAVAAEAATEDENAVADGGEVVDSAETAQSTTEEPTTEPTPVATPTPEPSPTPTSTPTPSPTPTATPLPTLTPTPIDSSEIVGTISTGGSTVWLRRTPGGAESLVLSNGDTVLVQSGNANQAGLIWKQVKTVNGVEGWILADFLAIEEAP